MSVLCPNCSQEVETQPVRCPRCGYRSEMAPEYFWLYLGGGALVLVGILIGILGVTSEGCPPDHWSRTFTGWYPLGPWPPSHHWLAFVVEGIALSCAGLGITRHRWPAWWLLVAVLAWDGLWALRKLALGAPPPPAAGAAAAVLAGTVLGAALAARLAIALQRTPPRDIRRLQAGLHAGPHSPTSRPPPSGAPAGGAEPDGSSGEKRPNAAS